MITKADGTAIRMIINGPLKSLQFTPLSGVLADDKATIGCATCNI